MKLGSLFDGSGGFPLAGSLCGIEPVWAAEVEPYPIAVTRSRFSKMKHLGSVTDINGAEIEPVDVITFGSPCQDFPHFFDDSHSLHEKTAACGFLVAVSFVFESCTLASYGQVVQRASHRLR